MTASVVSNTLIYIWCRCLLFRTSITVDIPLVHPGTPVAAIPSRISARGPACCCRFTSSPQLSSFNIYFYCIPGQHQHIQSLYLKSSIHACSSTDLTLIATIFDSPQIVPASSSFAAKLRGAKRAPLSTLEAQEEKLGRKHNQRRTRSEKT